jgi:hypothetical protein
MQRGDRRRAAAGLIGPAAFTAAWAVSGRRQEAYSIKDEHISGLAAPDARSPGLMTAGFLALGACTVAFASEVQRRLGGPARSGAGPALMAGAGVATLIAGLLRRDRMANVLPGEIEPYRQSLVNDGHDYASVIGQTATMLSLLAFARRFRGDPELAPLAPVALGTAAVSGGLSAYFARETVRPGNGIVQRIGISAPLAFMAATAVRMLRSDGSGSR